MIDARSLIDVRDIGRRTFFGRLGGATLSATAVALLAGRESLAAGMGDKAMAGDVTILRGPA